MIKIKTIPESAQLMRIQPVTLRKWIYEGKLPVCRLGRRVFLLEDDIEAFINASVVPKRKRDGSV